MQLPYAKVRIRHWNPGASMPLIIPVHLICNTSDEMIYANIRENAHNHKNWVKLRPAHDKVAVLCGSGPSLGDHVGEIKERQAAGQVVFAMNGAARFLDSHGVLPDYQVIIDAREATADLVGPAKHHLFASQVHPKCFELMPTAQLWHLQVGNIENEFPDYEDDYCLIGGAASVGNTATCLAYALGFRGLQIYGYDSSHRGESGHAFRQPMNDGDPTCVVNFNGKEYVASLTMKLQAEKFQETAKALQDAGVHIEVHGDGLLPDMWRAPKEVLEEPEKYRRMWDVREYRTYSPGELRVDAAINAFGMEPPTKVVDFGCGTGRASLAFKKRGFEVVSLDFAINCLDDGLADELDFRVANLWEGFDAPGDYGFCCDVMEHIPRDHVDGVLANIRKAVPNAFFNIAFTPDVFGEVIGQTLHLTVKPPEWWQAKLREHWGHVEFIDGSFICKQQETL